VSLGKFKPDLFLTGMGLAILLAWLLPAPGAKGGALHPEILTKAAIALVFFLNGALLSFAALKGGVMRWRLHLIIQGTTFLLFPLIGGLFLLLAGRWISQDLKVGLFYLCALPSTISSSVAMTAAARGNVPVAIFNAAISSPIGIFITPLWMSLMLQTSGQSLDIVGVFLDLTLWIIVPLVGGQLARPLIGTWLIAHRKWAQIADRGSILLLVYTSFCDSFAKNVWGSTSLPILSLTIAATLCLFFLVLFTLWKLCDRAGIDLSARSAVVFCGTKKGLAAGIPMAHLLFVGHPGLGLILLPIMIYHPLQLLICTPLASQWAKETDPVTP
jgi:solute carrier family 10 (sodium/bile acid cotransporter), member 7